MNHEIKSAIEELLNNFDTGYVNEDKFKSIKCVKDLFLYIESDESFLIDNELDYTYLAYYINNLYNFLYDGVSCNYDEIDNCDEDIDENIENLENLNMLLIGYIINKINSYEILVSDDLIQTELQHRFRPFVLKDTSLYEEVYDVYRLIRENKTMLANSIIPLLNYFKEITRECKDFEDDLVKNKINQLICDVGETTKSIIMNNDLKKVYKYKSATFEKQKFNVEICECKEGLKVKLFITKKMSELYAIGNSTFFPITVLSHLDFKVRGSSVLTKDGVLLSFTLPWDNVKDLMVSNSSLHLINILTPKTTEYVETTQFIKEPIVIDLKKSLEDLNYIIDKEKTTHIKYVI